jgi:indolepyruvate ferredoxin oxidoreductase beta subunit
VLETARLLGEAALQAGLDVVVGEWPGPPCGRGSVLVQVRMGEEVHAPVAPEASAEMLVGLEPLEALRALRFLAPGAFVALEEEPVPTWRMRAGLAPLPRDAAARIEGWPARVVAVRACALARSLGSAALQGLALLGVASPKLPVPREAFEAALAAGGPAAPAARREAFEAGVRLWEASHLGRTAHAGGG